MARRAAPESGGFTKAAPPGASSRLSAAAAGAVLDSAPLAIITVDRSGRILEVNRKTEQIFGYAPEELRGQSVEVLVPDELRKAHRRHRSLFMGAPQSRPIGAGRHLAGRRKDGTSVELEIGLSLVETPGGVLVIAAIADISERRRAEEVLDASEVRFRRLFEAARDGILLLDFETAAVIDANPYLLELFGYSRDELLGKRLWDLGFFADADASKVAFAELQARGYARYEDLPLQAKDGRRLDVEFVSNAYRVDQQKVIQCNIRDISERKRAETALGESDRRLRTVVDAAPVILWAIDRNGIFTLSEGRGLQALGLQPGEVVGRSVFEMYRDMPDICANIRRALAGEEITAVVRLGEVTFEARYAPLFDGKGGVTGVIGVATDISEQQRLADELRGLAGRLLEVQEEERRQVAYDIHDGLGQLVTAAAMHLEAFASRGLDHRPGDAEKELAKARRCVAEAVVEMRRLVSDVGPLLLEDLGLVEASRRLLNDTAERLEWDAEFDGALNGGRLERTAEMALFRIIQEALSNAAKHSGTERLELTIAPHEHTVRAEIRDSGQGFDIDALPGRSGGSKNIGLAGMRERAALVGGKLEINSRPGEGTTVVVTVPLSREGERKSATSKEANTMVEPRKSRATAGPDISVLIADDHPMVREGLRAMLDAEGIAVVGEASTGQEAVQAVQELNPDVVLMDVRMPDMDGLAATEVVKQESPHTSIIIVTSYESKEYLRRAVEVGAAGYILKGMSRESLIDAIRLVRGGGSLVDARLLAELLREMGIQGSRFEAAAEGVLESLTPRERDVLQLLVRGLTNKEIAQEMHYSVGTVKNVVQRVIDKLGVSDRTQAAVCAVRAGINPA